MNENLSLLLGIILCLAVVSESRVIVPRALPKEDSSGNGELPLIMNPTEKDKKLDFKPIIRGPPTFGGVYENDKRVNHPRIPIEDYDYYIPSAGDDKTEDNLPGTKPESFLPRADEWPERKPNRNDEKDRTDDEDFKKPFGEDLGRPSFDDSPLDKDDDEPKIGDTDTEGFEDDKIDKDLKPKDKKMQDEEVKYKPKADEENVDEEGKEDEKTEPEDDEKKTDEGRKEEEKPEPGDDEEKGDEEGKEDEKTEPEDDEKKTDEERKEEEKPEPGDDEEKEDGEEKHEPENDDDKKYVPEEESVGNENKGEEIPKEDDESIHDAEEAELSGGDSIFNNPFFNLEQVKKYFSTLDRALGQVYRQTLDEARLLNGTYANTTEEEVDIDGQKYLITKSIIKGGDNHSSIYVESLVSKPKMNESEVFEHFEVKNVTLR